MRRTTSLLFLLPVLACTDLGPGPTDNGTRLQVVNGARTAGAVDVFVDGNAALRGVPVAQTGTTLELLPGPHSIRVVSAAGGTGYARLILLQTGVPVTVVAVDTVGGVAPAVLADTNAVVPAGATKLRVAHMATGAAPISIWRTQPDFGTMIRVQFPFPYRAVSPYLQSTPGDWEVMVSSEDNTAGSVPMPDTLAATGPITIPEGGSRTVVVVEKAGGGVALVVVSP